MVPLDIFWTLLKADFLQILLGHLTKDKEDFWTESLILIQSFSSPST